MKLEGATALPRSSTLVAPRFAQRLSAGDLDGATSCFARDACLITPDATAIHGREQIRDVLAQMVSRRTEIQVDLSSSISAGDVLLVHQRWQIRSGEPRRGRFTQTVDAILVLRHLEGAWKFSIAAPWGYGRAYG